MSVARTARRRRRQAKLDTRYMPRKESPPKKSQGLAKLLFQRASSAKPA